MVELLEPPVLPPLPAVEGLVVDHSAAHPALAKALALEYSDREVCHVRPLIPQSSATTDVATESLGQLLSNTWSRWLSPLMGKPTLNPSNREHSLDPDGHLTGLNDVGLLWSNMLLHRLQSPPQIFKQWAQCIKPGGALFFSCLGPDSAKELRVALERMGYESWDYADMHDLGDALVHAGFSDPVMEMEKITLTYQSAEALLQEWRTTETGYPLRKKGLEGAVPQSGLKTQRFLKALSTVLAENRAESQPLFSITLEVIYGHAWYVERKQKTTQATVAVSDIGGRKPRNMS